MAVLHIERAATGLGGWEVAHTWQQPPPAPSVQAPTPHCSSAHRPWPSRSTQLPIGRDGMSGLWSRWTHHVDLHLARRLARRLATGAPLRLVVAGDHHLGRGPRRTRPAIQPPTVVVVLRTLRTGPRPANSRGWPSATLHGNGRLRPRCLAACAIPPSSSDRRQRSPAHRACRHTGSDHNRTFRGLRCNRASLAGSCQCVTTGSRAPTVEIARLWVANGGPTLHERSNRCLACSCSLADELLPGKRAGL